MGCSWDPEPFCDFFRTCNASTTSRDVSFVVSVIRLLVVPTLTVILKFGIDFIPNFVSSIHNFPRMSRGCYLPCFFQRFQMPTNFHKRYPSHPPGPSSAPSSSEPKFHRRTLPGAHAPALLWFEAPGEKGSPVPQSSQETYQLRQRKSGQVLGFHSDMLKY